MLDRAVRALGSADFLTWIVVKIAALLVIAIGIIGASAPSGRAADTNIE
jgi:hypothetical protein